MRKPKQATHRILSNYDGLAFQIGEEVEHIGNGKYKALTKQVGKHYREGWVQDEQIEKI